MPAGAFNMSSSAIAELLDLIRRGDAGAAEELVCIFLPGARFLIQRRLGKSDVDGEARSALATVIRGIESDVSITPQLLTRMIRQFIQQRFSPNKRPGDPPSAEPDGAAIQAAADILGHLSPIERDALRRCYVLGESPEAFVGGLKLTLDEFRAIRSRAREEFAARRPKATYAA
jgi:DNA-directed RNA polymerase specialized sigma24 family protein